MNLLPLALEWLLLLVLVSLSAFFSGSETAFFSLSPVQVQRIRNQNAAAGERIERLLRDPALLLSTLLVGNTFVNFAFGSLGYMMIARVAPANWRQAIAIPTLTLTLLLFGEVTPKRLAMDHAERLAPFCSRILLLWLWLLRPCNAILMGGSRVFKKALRRERRALSNDELLTIVEVGEEQGVLDTEEASMVDGIMRFSELKASDEMTPRVDMVGLDLDTPIERQLEIARAAGFRYLPVYIRTPDAIEGFVNTVQFLLSPAPDARAMISPALFVPENVALDDLLVTFQRSGKHIACVLDEYGGTAGLITRSDILELIAAPVNRGAAARPEIRQVAPETWLADGTVSLETLNHELDLALEADDADRISGWVTFHAGHLPHVGEVIEAQGCRVKIRRVRRRRIEAVQIEALDRSDPSQDPLHEGDDAPYDTAGEDDLA